MTPIHNFSPGPGALPESVLAQTREALDAIPGSRIPLLGLSHRTPLFAHILEEAEANFRALLTRVPDGLPTLLDYRTHVAHRSNYNTPPLFAIYVVLLVTRWLLREVGGLAAMAAINRAKAARLYAVLDASGGFYRGHAARADRSLMNVAFTLPSAGLQRRFVAEAEARGLYGLQGHRAIGGLRASLYNGVSPASVEALCAYMEAFRSDHADGAGHPAGDRVAPAPEAACLEAVP